MDYFLQLAGIAIAIHSERPLTVAPEYQSFLLDSPASSDVDVFLSWDWEKVTLPVAPMLGEDALQQYYQEGPQWYCLTKAGPKGPIACAQYDADFRQIHCTINEKPFLMPTKAFASVIRMLPLRALLLHFDVLFFHASQISLHGKGILFTAPSGTGKTTQARLWEKYRSAELVCNDRVLVRCVNGVWQTFGYPLDGSEPVCSNQVNRLSAIVLLQQGIQNRVSQPSPSQTLRFLMGQMVMDCWSGPAREAHVLRLISLIGQIPVLQLTCTPDYAAVEALEQALIERKVFPYG